MEAGCAAKVGRGVHRWMTYRRITFGRRDCLTRDNAWKKHYFEPFVSSSRELELVSSCFILFPLFLWSFVFCCSDGEMEGARTCCLHPRRSFQERGDDVSPSDRYGLMQLSLLSGTCGQAPLRGCGPPPFCARALSLYDWDGALPHVHQWLKIFAAKSWTRSVNELRISSSLGWSIIFADALLPYMI